MTTIGGNRDPFAHYLRVGIAADIDPGPGIGCRAVPHDENEHVGAATATGGEQRS